MKRIISIMLCIFVLAGLVGCGAAPKAEEPKTEEPVAAETKVKEEKPIELEVVCNITNAGTIDQVMEELIAEFTEETGIKVNYNPMGDGYEGLLKTRMASNDMPDVFTTHGWAVVRYGEYLEPLTTCSFANDVVDGIRGVVTDANGDLLVLPAAYNVSGINYNGDVLKEAGVDASSIRTWADFEAACEAVKAIGKTPVAVGGKDTWTAAMFYEYVCASLFSGDEDVAAIADGSFDWEKIRTVSQMHADWVDKGFFNVDAITADYASTTKNMGLGEVAFIMNGTDAVSTGLQYNAEADLHVMPTPVADDNDEPFAVGGEYLSWGVWKDSKNKEAAKQFVEFLARKENITKQANALLTVPGVAGAEFDAGILTEDFANLMNYPVRGVWDRYLPSGMFNDMITSGLAILAQESNAVDTSVSTFKTSYLEKIG